MSKYIKLEDAVNGLEEEHKVMIDLCDFREAIGVKFAQQYLETELPTIDIVRCEDCKHINKSQRVTNLDGTEKRYKCDCIDSYMLERNFCSFGERSDNE